MKTQLDEKTLVLQEQVKKLQSQKDALLKELDTVEERFEQTDRMYRKYMPVVLDVVSKGNSGFARACSNLSQGFKKGDSTEKMAYVFEALKTAMIHEGIGPVPLKKKKGGMLSSFMKGSSDDAFVDEFKQDYHEVLNKLRSTLENKYVPRLDTILNMLVNASDTSDIADIRSSVFSLIFTYIADTSQDREKVNAFIQEIVAKILDIETKLAGSFEQTQSVFQNNSGFESTLSEEMDGLRKSSDVAVSLEDLKVQITQRLTSIDKALTKKQAADNAIRQVVEKNRNAFKNGFTKLRKELDEATRYAEQLEQKLNQDQLTGAYNRRAYDRKMEDEMARFQRYNTMFSLLLLDADKFKSINDRFGHAIGDRVLKEIIKRTIPLLRKNDMLARYGGEEFAVIMPETDAEGARKAAEKIRQTIEKIEFLYKKETVRVTVSIGVSQIKEGDETHQKLFERADIAVYKAKENGRNQVLVY